MENSALMGCETILVVENDPDTRAIVKATLEDFNYGVLETKTRGDALEILHRHGENVDLVLAGLGPDPDRGAEFARELLRAKPGIRLIAMVGTDHIPPLTDEVPEANGFTLIQKPFSLKELGTLLKEQLSNTGPI